MTKDCGDVAIISTSRKIPVARALLPGFDRLEPYLRKIDSHRYYSNHGPLVIELEARLQRRLDLPPHRLDLPPHRIVACASGTSALMGAMLAVGDKIGETNPLCLMPAFSFTATAAAARLSGFSPHLVDIEPETLALCPEKLRSHPKLSEARLVVPVAPFGRAIDLAAWGQFASDTGIPVVIDAAAGFEWLTSPGIRIPASLVVAVSLHATKAFGSGEGGLIIAPDPDKAMRSYQAINHGFVGTRQAELLATNGKMSEYHAAVALAELDGWDEKHAAYSHVGQLLQGEWQKYPKDGLLWTAPEVAGCYTLYTAANQSAAEAAQAALAMQNIETRFWYGKGVQSHPAHSNLSRDDLPNTIDAAGRCLGLPAFFDMTADEASRIIRALP